MNMPKLSISLLSPNGQRGCLTVVIGRACLTLGLTRAMAGLDISYGSRMLFAWPTDQRL